MAPFRRLISAPPSTLPVLYADGGSLAPAADSLMGGLGAGLAQFVPALQLPYVHVTKAKPVPLDLSDIKEKYRVQSEDALGKALKSSDDLWNSRISGLGLHPYQTEILNERRRAFQNDLYSKVAANPLYLSSPANLNEISQRMQELVYSPDIDAMRAKVEETKQRQAKLEATPGLADAPYRNKQGQVQYHPETGEMLTNAGMLNLVRTSRDPRLRQQVEGPGGRPVGNYLQVSPVNPSGDWTAGTWTGTLDDATKYIDGFGALAQASSSKTGRGGFKPMQLSDDERLRFGTQYDALMKTRSSVGNESNASALATIMGAMTKGGWERVLPQTAVQGLKDHFYQAYQNNSFGDIFSKTTLTSTGGRPVPPGMSIGQVARAARLGMLKDSDRILEQIEKHEGQYINNRAVRYIADRIGARGYKDTSDEYETQLDLNTTGGADTAKNNDNEVEDAYDGLTSSYSEGVPQADQTQGTGLVTQLKKPYSSEQTAKYQEYYSPKGQQAKTLLAYSGAGGLPVYLPGAAHQNLAELFGLKGADGASLAVDGLNTQAIYSKMKVQSFGAPVRVPRSTPGSQSELLNRQLVAAGTDVSHAQMILGRMQSSTGNTRANATEIAEQQQTVAQAQQHYKQLREQLMNASDAELTPIRHEVNVVMRLDDFKNMKERFASRSKDGSVRTAYSPAMGFLPWDTADTDFDGKQDPAINPHNVRYFDKEESQKEERTRLGFSDDEKLVQFSVQIAQPMNETYAGGNKGQRAHSAQQLVNQRRGELMRAGNKLTGSLSGN